MTNFLRTQGKRLLSVLPSQFACTLEFKAQSFVGFNERPVEYAFLFKWLEKLYPKTILDVGTGTTALPHLMRHCGCLVTAIDNVRDYWPSGMSNRHYHVLDEDITAPRLNIRDSFDLITCISVLEHIEQHDVAIRNIFSLLTSRGHLILTFPYSEGHYVKNVYQLPGSNAFGKRAPFICQSFSRHELSKWLHDNEGEIVEQEYWQFWDGDFWTIGSQVIPPIRSQREGKHQLVCLAIQKKP